MSDQSQSLASAQEADPLLEDSRGREVLLVGRLGPARHATRDNLAFQLPDIERQAGVRRTLCGTGSVRRTAAAAPGWVPGGP